MVQESRSLFIQQVRFMCDLVRSHVIRHFLIQILNCRVHIKQRAYV